MSNRRDVELDSVSYKHFSNIGQWLNETGECVDLVNVSLKRNESKRNDFCFRNSICNKNAPRITSLIVTGLKIRSHTRSPHSATLFISFAFSHLLLDLFESCMTYQHERTFYEWFNIKRNTFHKSILYHRNEEEKDRQSNGCAFMNKWFSVTTIK